MKPIKDLIKRETWREMRNTEARTRIDATVTIDFEELRKLLGIDKIIKIEVLTSMSDNESELNITTVRVEDER